MQAPLTEENGRHRLHDAAIGFMLGSITEQPTGCKMSWRDRRE